MTEDTEHYEDLAANSTGQILGGFGASGDYIETLIVDVANPAACAVSLKDGSGGTQIDVFPTNPGAGIGTYILPLRLRSRQGGWHITTGGGVLVTAVGKFS